MKKIPLKEIVRSWLSPSGVPLTDVEEGAWAGNLNYPDPELEERLDAAREVSDYWGSDAPEEWYITEWVVVPVEGKAVQRKGGVWIPKLTLYSPEGETFGAFSTRLIRCMRNIVRYFGEEVFYDPPVRVVFSWGDPDARFPRWRLTYSHE